MIKALRAIISERIEHCTTCDKETRQKEQVDEDNRWEPDWICTECNEKVDD